MSYLIVHGQPSFIHSHIFLWVHCDDVEIDCVTVSLKYVYVLRKVVNTQKIMSYIYLNIM